MAESGFLVKFNGKKVFRCYAVSFDYDEWQYTINNKITKKLPQSVKRIVIEVERENRSA